MSKSIARIVARRCDRREACRALRGRRALAVEIAQAHRQRRSRPCQGCNAARGLWRCHGCGRHSPTASFRPRRTCMKLDPSTFLRSVAGKAVLATGVVLLAFGGAAAAGFTDVPAVLPSGDEPTLQDTSEDDSSSEATDESSEESSEDESSEDESSEDESSEDSSSADESSEDESSEVESSADESPEDESSEDESS